MHLLQFYRFSTCGSCLSQSRTHTLRPHAVRMNSCASQKSLATPSPDILSSSSVKGAIVDISAHIPKPIPRNDNDRHRLSGGRCQRKMSTKRIPTRMYVLHASFEYSVFSLRLATVLAAIPALGRRMRLRERL